MIGAGVAAVILPFLISMIGGGSYYRDQEPDVLANEAEQQIARGEHYAALDTVNLALLRSPDAGTRERLEEMKKKIAAATAHSRDKGAVELAGKGADAIREIDKQYPAATRSQAATRELTRRAKAWLDRFEGLATANPEIEPLLKEIQAIHDINKVKAQLERADDSTDIMFKVDRRLGLATPMWREAVRDIVDYVASHQNDPQIHTLNARKVEIIDMARAAFDRHGSSARSFAAEGRTADANKQLDLMRNAIVVPSWSPAADAVEREIAARK